VDVTLDVIGQGDARIPMPAVASGVTFHGRVPEQELRRRIQNCDVFVAPSTGQESFGIVLVEAMACGRPLVCSDIDGYREVASPLGARLVPPRDGHALAEALQSLCRDAGLRRAMGQHNRAEALRYDWSTVAAQIEEEYELALGHATVALDRAAAPAARVYPRIVERDARARRAASQ
jgi:phosphatidylinositol alpha-mannosyltransferase